MCGIHDSSVEDSDLASDSQTRPGRVYRGTLHVGRPIYGPGLGAFSAFLAFPSWSVVFRHPSDGSRINTFISVYCIRMPLLKLVNSIRKRFVPSDTGLLFGDTFDNLVWLPKALFTMKTALTITCKVCLTLDDER